jgi:hypothetical protein
MPDMYKDKYLKKTKLQTWLHAYLGTIQVHIWIFKIYLGNTAKYPNMGGPALRKWNWCNFPALPIAPYMLKLKFSISR